MNQMMGNMFNDPFSMSPFGMRGSPMNMMGMISPFGGMPNMMQMMQQNNGMPNGSSSFMQSSFVSYSSDGVNPPQVVEQTHMNRYGPDGVKEERRTMRDSRTGVQKMSIGRHIDERGHVMERSRNHHTGEEEENNEFINIEEEEAPQFQQEWSNRMGSGSRHSNHRYIQGHPRHERRGEPVLAITAGPSSGMAEPIVNVPSPSSSSSDSRNKRLRVKPNSMKKEKTKSKKPYSKE